MIDFLVIGGGIAGLSAAARLSAHGHVTVLEAEDGLGYHASGRSAALFEESYGPPSVVALNKASASFLQNQYGGYLTPRSLLLIGHKNRPQDFEEDARDLNMQILPPAEAMTRVPILNPDTVGFTAVSNAAFDIDTDRLMQDFAALFAAMAARF